jgi:hypothetical protein
VVQRGFPNGYRSEEVRKGDDAATLVLKISESIHALEQMTFLVYPPEPGVLERLAPADSSNGENALVRSAGSVGVEGHLTREDDFVRLFSESSGTREVLAEMLRHDEEAEARSRLSSTISDLRSGWLENLVTALPEESALALCSKCELSDGSGVHIPMIDFRCSTTEQNLRLLTEAVLELGEKAGVFLTSGKSYHYYGLVPLDHHAWLKFLGRCLLLNPLVDTRYVGHRLIAGMCQLRITKTLHSQVPRVVALVRS